MDNAPRALYILISWLVLRTISDHVVKAVCDRYCTTGADAVLVNFLCKHCAEFVSVDGGLSEVEIDGGNGITDWKLPYGVVSGYRGAPVFEHVTKDESTLKTGVHEVSFIQDVFHSSSPEV